MKIKYGICCAIIDNPGGNELTYIIPNIGDIITEIPYMIIDFDHTRLENDRKWFMIKIFNLFIMFEG